MDLISITLFTGKIYALLKVHKNITNIGGGGVLPSQDSKLMKQIVTQFGSSDNMINHFIDRFLKIQGSGWNWIVYCQNSKSLIVKETKDQDPVCLKPNEVPILGIDCWEHAWYVNYKNKKPDYIKNIWKVVNWKDVEARYDYATKDQ